MNPITETARLIAANALYTGGPIQFFESVGRDCIITLLRNGLRPDHQLLDFGCGTLRLGYWLVRFMDDGHYFGIEPNEKMLQAGKTYSLGTELIERKSPRFSSNADCDFSVFGTRFDFVVARSILTHTTPGMLRKIIQEFHKNTTEQGRMLASYWPLSVTLQKEKEVIGDDLDENDWRFLTIVKYSFQRIAAWAEENKVHVEEWKELPLINNQVWLLFSKAG
jgi:SAM-dependent methyltransferase